MAPTDPCPPRPNAAPGAVLRPESWFRRRRGFVYRPGDPVEAEFPPERMVRWLSPQGLASTAFRVLLAGIFGLYSDKREIEAVLPKPNVPDLSDRDELWLDYVADLADGWNPTYAVASLLAGAKLDVSAGGESFSTRRGEVLVMGGDQVYPFATEEQYVHRLVAPYLAALPCTLDPEPPRLYAIPGNHDWYDGLTTFLRLFCRRQWVGGWRTEQERSYFALQLPGGWWLWGLDIQFDFYIDEPQLRFFEEVAAGRRGEGDKLILCTARPSWVHEKLEGDKTSRLRAKRNLEYFEREVVRKHGWRLLVSISGDHHHYARYESDDGSRQKLTCGGGGAFLYPTHVLPGTVDWPETEGEPEITYGRAAEHPSIQESRRLRSRALLVPFTNPSFWALMGVVHLLFAWMIRFGMRVGPAGEGRSIRGADSLDLLFGLVRNPVSLIFAIIVTVALVAFAGLGHWGRLARWPVGVGHAAIQLAVVIGLMRAFTAPFMGLSVEAFIPVFLVLMAVVGGLAGSLVMGAYLWLSQLAGFHANEAFSSAHLQGYKSFLRLRIDRDGSLTIFPIGLDEVPQTWRLAQRGRPEDPWFEATAGELAPRLIERPIRIEPSRGSRR